jgi:hypothetical protein
MQAVMPWLPKRYPRIEAILLRTIERSWVTGMFAYGDDPNSGYDYSKIGLSGTVWINNEHDFTSQAVIQYWRSNRAQALTSAQLCAEHQIDVDFVRKSSDRWKQGGIPAHSRKSVYAQRTPRRDRDHRHPGSAPAVAHPLFGEVHKLHQQPPPDCAVPLNAASDRPSYRIAGEQPSSPTPTP